MIVSIEYFKQLVLFIQRSGIADGGELEFRPPGTAAWHFIKLNVKN